VDDFKKEIKKEKKLKEKGKKQIKGKEKREGKEDEKKVIEDMDEESSLLFSPFNVNSNAS